MLPTEHPEIYELFISGQFVVKTNTGSINQAAPDMKLQQNHSALKRFWWCDRETSNKKFITEWETAYREILSICMYF